MQQHICINGLLRDLSLKLVSQAFKMGSLGLIYLFKYQHYESP